MIKVSALALGAAAALFAAPASAAVIYNAIHTTSSYSATAIGTGGPLAISFDLPTSQTITDIKIAMNANAPTDGGSVLVYLVPDDGSGPPPAAGMPSGGNSFTGKQLIGTIADSSLVLAGGTGPGQSAGIVNLNEYLTLAAGEYWLGFVTSGTSSAKLAFDVNSYTGGTGFAGQKDYTNTSYGVYSVVTGTGTGSLQPGVGNRIFEAEVFTPEPASLAILGVAMAGLGLVRRRRGRN